MKGYVRDNNKTQTISEARRLFKEGVNNIKRENWENVVKHTKSIIEEAWNQEGLLEEVIESVIINLGSGSSTDVSSQPSDNYKSEDD